MKPWSPSRVFWAIIGVAVIARLVAAFRAPPVHPDQVFQYLEPAWHRLRGLGYDTWEWHDGIRSWALTGYHGALLALFDLFGVTKGRTLQKLLAVHWALASVLLVWAASRGARSFARGFGTTAEDETRAERASLVAAALVATFPLLVSFAPQTLSENPSMIALVWGLVLAAEASWQRGDAAIRRAAWAGACLSLGVCLRIANAPLALVPFVWLLARRRVRESAALVGGALAPVLLFGLLDLATWGRFLSSFLGYLKFNLIEGKAAEFGVEPWYFYVERMHARLPVVCLPLLLLALWSTRRTWPILASFACGLGYLSLTPHKEERFGVLLWVYLLMAAAVGSAELIERVKRKRIGIAVAVAGFALLVTVGQLRLTIRDSDQSHAVRDAQAWVGRAPDATGLLLDDLFISGGYMAFDSSLPMALMTPELLSNPLYNYVVARRGSEAARAARAHGFQRVHAFGSRWILRRSATSGHAEAASD